MNVINQEGAAMDVSVQSDSSSEESLDPTVELMIMLVEDKSFLYDKSLKEYKDVRLRNNTWGVIAEECGLSKEAATAKWKSLRDRYARERRTLLKKKSGAGASDVRSQWPAFKHMQFLDPFIATRTCASNLKRTSSSESASCSPDEENVDDDLGGSDSETTVTDNSSCLSNDKSSKRKQPADKDLFAQGFSDIAQALKKKQERKEELDEDDSFARNLAIELKKIKSIRLKKQLKMKISTLLYEVDEGDD